MITKITIENFRGINNSRTISFLANAKRVKSKIGTAKINNKEILLVNSLLGKNASGKTGFIQGFTFFISLALGNAYKTWFNHLQTLYQRKVRNGEKININLRLEDVMNEILKGDFNDSNKSIKIYLEFLDSKSTFGLSIELTNSGMVKEQVTKNGMFFSNKVDSLETFKSEIFYEHFKNYRFYDNYAIFTNFTSYPVSGIFQNETYKNKMLNWIRISDDKIVKIIWTSKNQIEGFIISHAGIEKKITLFELSSGTGKWMSLGFAIFRSFREKSIFVIDEIDNSLHPSLVKFIFLIFNDLQINKKGCQLIFTSHSPLTVEKPFRKDAINFIDDTGDIINLGNEKIREDFSIVKNFLSEKLSSHPYKSNMFEWLEEFYE